jgi:hypothetical protein
MAGRNLNPVAVDDAGASVRGDGGDGARHFRTPPHDSISATTHRQNSASVMSY